MPPVTGEDAETDDGSEGDLPEGSERAPPPSQRVEELEAEVDELRSQVEALETELNEAREGKEELTDTLARVQADYENYRKRAKREKREAARDARVELVGVLAEVVDNVERAMDADPSPDVRTGLELVLRQIEHELEELGVVTLDPEPGDPFDPNDHEPMITEETDEHEPETVIERLSPGYELEGRQIRPAMVKVAQAPSEPTDAEARASDGEDEDG